MAIGISLLLLAVWPSISIHESLWVDELHSAWVIADRWDEIGHRAALGNQSPLYFCGLKTWANVIGSLVISGKPTEAGLRFSSLLAWIALCALTVRTLFRTTTSRTRLPTLMVVVGWLLLDRIGAFYALELRPYVWVALSSLLVMRFGAKLVENPIQISWIWMLASGLAFYLHYTSIIVIAFSWLGCIIAIAIRWRDFESSGRMQILRAQAFQIILLATLLAPGLFQLATISRKSQQWASFAGDASLMKVVDLLPWFFWTIIPMLVFAAQRSMLIGSIKTRTGSVSDGHLSEVKNATSQPSHNEIIQPKSTSQSLFAWLLQLCLVGYGSLLFVWFLTFSETAPLLHRRYIFGAYPAFLLLGAFWLGRIHDLRLLLLTGALSAALMIWWQGTLTEWQAGRFVAWQRQEDWRRAVAFLNEYRKNNEQIFLAPMLVETAGDKIDPTLDVGYLRYPMTSFYPIQDANSIRLLPNNFDRWETEISQALSNSTDENAWLVARGPWDGSLAIRAGSISDGPETTNPPSTLTEKPQWKTEKRFYGGRVQVWKLEKR